MLAAGAVDQHAITSVCGSPNCDEAPVRSASSAAPGRRLLVHDQKGEVGPRGKRLQRMLVSPKALSSSLFKPAYVIVVEVFVLDRDRVLREGTY